VPSAPAGCPASWRCCTRTCPIASHGGIAARALNRHPRPPALNRRRARGNCIGPLEQLRSHRRSTGASCASRCPIGRGQSACSIIGTEPSPPQIQNRAPSPLLQLNPLAAFCQGRTNRPAPRRLRSGMSVGRGAVVSARSRLGSSRFARRPAVLAWCARFARCPRNYRSSPAIRMPTGLARAGVLGERTYPQSAAGERFAIRFLDRLPRGD